MKRMLVYLCLIFASYWGAMGRAETNEMRSSSNLQFRTFSPKREVAMEYYQLTSTASRIDFLVSKIQKKPAPGDEMASWEKATAIRMLGKLHPTNAIDVILSELEFIDIKSWTYPATYALIDIGEPAVSNILDHAIMAKPKKEYRVVDAAGEALYQILGRQRFREFIEEHKDRMSNLTLQGLSARTVD